MNSISITSRRREMTRSLMLAWIFAFSSPQAALTCSVYSVDNTSAVLMPTSGLPARGRRLSAAGSASHGNAPGAAAAASVLNTALLLAEIEDCGAEPFRAVLHDAAAHYGLKFCGVDCEQRRRWHRNSKWRQACRTLVGGYVLGMCPGRAYFTGDAWVPCKTLVAVRVTTTHAHALTSHAHISLCLYLAQDTRTHSHSFLSGSTNALERA